MNGLSETELMRVRRLCDEADVSALMADYAHAIDWLDWARLEPLFWPDATLDFGMFAGTLDAYMDFVRTLEEGYRRRLHMFAVPVVQVTGDRARIDAGSVIVCRTDTEGFGRDDMFWGRYLFDAERRNGVWRLSCLRYILNLVDMRDRVADDRGGVMTMGDDLTPAHPLAWTR